MRRLALILTALLLTPRLQAADHAAILLYHHVSNSTPSGTSVSPAVFRQHLDSLSTGGYSVLSLSHILETLASGGSLPDKTVAITFDDAYRSVLDAAAPLLRKHGWPFTVFVSTQAIDEGYRDYLTWKGLRELIRDGAEIGNHSYSHLHLVRRLAGESQQQWHARIVVDIKRAQRELHEQLGVTSIMFSYPYGEYTAELQEIVGSLGYFGLVQQSGAVGPDFNPLAVPRYALATDYEDMRRFFISVNSRPLPVRKVEAEPRIQVAGESIHYRFAFNIVPGDFRLVDLNCYNSSSGTRLVLKKQNDSGVARISMRLPDWGPGRRKINCTAPSSHEPGVFFWYSQLWLIKNADGRWYQE